MLHIILLSEGYFPDNINVKSGEDNRVVVIASRDGAIPVSAYQNEQLKGIEVKLLPEIKGNNAKDTAQLEKMAQAVIVGELISGNTEYEIYAADKAMETVLSAFGQKSGEVRAKKAGRKPAARKKAEAGKKARKNASVKEKAPLKEDAPTENTAEKLPEAVEKNEKKNEEKKEEMAPVKKKPATRRTKAEKAVKLPSAAQIKKALGAQNSGYLKTVQQALKSSNQITFEMNLRMELAKAGMEGTACQDLAKTLNDEFGKALPTA